MSLMRSAAAALSWPPVIQRTEDTELDDLASVTSDPEMEASSEPGETITDIPSLLEIELGDHPDIVALAEAVGLLEDLRAEIDSPDENRTDEEKKLWEEKVWQRIEDTSLYKRYKEANWDQNMICVALIAAARILISELSATSLDVSEGTLTEIKAHYYRTLNTLSPYFTQMTNMNILWKGSKEKGQAWRRTCNVTSLSMTLQALGVGPDQFTGDKDLLTKIANHLVPGFGSFDDMAGLRMPDFVQFVAVYTAYKDGPEDKFGERVDKARDEIAPKISTTLDIFEAITKLFAVQRTKTGNINSKGYEADNNKKRAEKGEAEVDLSGFTAAKYKQAVLKEIPQWLDRGAQIVINRPGHYLRLQAVNEEGIVVDDPAQLGKAYPVDWTEANNTGYFRSWQAFEAG